MPRVLSHLHCRMESVIFQPRTTLRVFRQRRNYPSYVLHTGKRGNDLAFADANEGIPGTGAPGTKGDWELPVASATTER